MKLFATLAISIMSFAVVALTSTPADAACSCAKAEIKCRKNASKIKPMTAKHGKSGKAMKERMKAFKKCDQAWRKCARKCGKECMKDCRSREKTAKKNCREDFKDSLCPIKGKEARSCKKDAKKARKECTKDADIKCVKVCKK
ncbi:MAG: hypothetical protein VB934_09260 [Polyangiaceae bacterium]